MPRMRNIATGEVALESYTRMKEPGQFSEELLEKMLRGISERKYSETVVEGAKAFGVSISSASRRIVEITSQKLQEFTERDLSVFTPFSVYIDKVYRPGEALHSVSRSGSSGK